MPQIADAFGLLGLVYDILDARYEQGRQNSEDGDDDEYLDQAESPIRPMGYGKGRLQGGVVQ